MKEEEAKTKWCPMARAMVHAGPNTVAANRFGQGSKDYINCKCIASDCMMWVPTDNEYDPGVNPADEGASHPAGHCGLAK